MKHLLVSALILLMVSACSPESATDSPTATVSKSATNTADADEPARLSPEPSTKDARTESLPRGQSKVISAIEKEDVEENVASSTIESENPVAIKPAATRLTAENPVAPSGSVDLGNLPRTPADDQDEPGQLVVMPAPGDPDQRKKIEEQAKQDLAERLEVRLNAISTVSLEQKEWSDSSLGCHSRGMIYLQVITPGYLVVLEAEGEQFEYHTDMNDHIVLCQDGRPLD